MSIYILLLLYLLFLSLIFLNKKFNKLVFIILAFTPFVAISGFRSFSVGVDTQQFVNAYSRIINMSPNSFDLLRYEYGFSYFCWLLGKISTNPQILIFITSLFINISVGRFIYKNSDNVYLSVILYLLCNFFFSYMNIMRQAMAIAILLWGYEFIKDKQKEANLSAIGKGLSEQTIAIIPKMREVDEFLLSNEEYMNVIRESHPEVCFARLNGEVLMTNKSEKEGITDRVQVLSRYLQGVSEEYVRTSAKKLGCKPDDILDAVCLAVTANLDAQGRTEIIPENSSTDDKGLKMQMVIPKG